MSPGHLLTTNSTLTPALSHPMGEGETATLLDKNRHLLIGRHAGERNVTKVVFDKSESLTTLLKEGEVFMYENVRRHTGWFIALGVALMVLGVIGLVAVVHATLVSVILFGWLLLVGGIAAIIHAFRVRPWTGLLLQLLLGILYIIVGLLVIANPGSGALALTLLMAMFFIVGGICRIFMAVPEHFPGRGWAIFNGIIDVLLGILIWVHWPSTAFWVIGLFIAVDLIITGWWFVALGMASRRLLAPPAPAV